MKKRNVQEVHETGPLTKDELARDFVKPQKAVVIRGGAAEWPATKNWSFEYIGSLRPDLPVVLEVGNVMQAPGEIQHTTLQHYTDVLMPQNDARDANEEFAYLSILKLFDEIPELRKDVDFSVLADQMMYNKMVGWLGPAGTITGYHADWAHNLFAQIVGRKQFLMVPPGNHDTMYPSEKYDRYSYQSHIDVEKWNPDEYPRYADAPTVTVVLEPGDTFYVPPRWWHHVKSLDASISANNFGYTLLHGARSLVHDRVKRWRSIDDREHSVMAQREPVDAS